MIDTMPQTGDRQGAYAAFDLGTNNCRMLVAVPSRRGFQVVDSFSRIVRLGEGLQATGMLSEAAMERTLEALLLCRARLARRPMRAMRAVATEACRQAGNGAAFLARVRAATGLAFDVISAREEAGLMVESCAPLLTGPGGHALVFDIGGGSTELAWLRLEPGREPAVLGFETLPVGVVTLAERFGTGVRGAAGFRAVVDHVRGLLLPFEAAHGIAARMEGVQMLGSSGTVTTLAGVALRLPRYRRQLVDGVTLPAGQAMAAVAALRALDGAGLAGHGCVGADRAEFVLPGCAVFQAILEVWPAAAVTVADRGLREGMLQRLMRQDRDAADPARGAARAATVFA